MMIFLLKPFEWLEIYFLKPVTKFLFMEGAGIFLVPALFIIFILNTWHENGIEDMEIICSKVESIRENPLIPRARSLMLMDCMNAGGDEKICFQSIPEDMYAENLNSDLYKIGQICKDPF